MVQVKVSEGILEGEEVVNKYNSGKKFYSFKGVPYAEPPLGNLRFKAPQPCKSWEGVRHAKEHGPICYQYDMFGHFPPRGSEDCLYLNIYTPSLNPPEALPVMFWIHGGGFVSGSGDDCWYGPEYLIKKDVVLVTINYRLEILGFLCLDREEVPGNAGVKDQVAALRWVNKNIKNFGGNPDNVTIFGESAGAGCIGYHLVSPMTKGLFKRAILQSGAHTCWWSYVTNAKERALVLANQLGFHSENDEELYEFFKSQPVESLIMQQTNAPITLAEKEKSCYEPAFVIVDEKKFCENERFYCGDFSLNDLANIHEGVEIFIGFTKHEGLICLTVGSQLEKTCNQMSNFYEEFVPKHIADACPISEQLKVGETLKDFYFNKRNIAVKDWDKIVEFYGTNFFYYNIIQLSNMISFRKKNNIFMYQFSCLSKRNQFVKYLRFESLVKDKPLVSHCDDLLYLFSGKSFRDSFQGPEELHLIDTVTTIWTNFAKYGNPTPDDTLGVKWPAYTPKKQEYLDIGNVLQIRTAPHQREMKLWESIYRTYAPKYICTFESD